MKLVNLGCLRYHCIRLLHCGHMNSIDYKILVSMQLLSWSDLGVWNFETYGAWHEWKPQILMQLFGCVVITGENCWNKFVVENLLM